MKSGPEMGNGLGENGSVELPEVHRMNDEDLTAPEEEEEVPEPPPHGRIPPEEAEAGETGAEAEGRPATLADLDIYDTLRFMIGVLNQAAWMHLGLVVAPGKSEAQTDLAQARVAIDALEALAGQLRLVADAIEQRELDSILANLRINYVKRAE